MNTAAFVGASLVLAVTPGPGVAYVVTRTLAQGRAAGLASVAGVAVGNLGSASAAALGLAALLAASRIAFVVVTWVGALYLIVLGVQALRSAGRRAPGAAPRADPPAGLRRLGRDGAVVALANPKTALFFAAFLPQFVDPAAPALPQALALGAGFVAIAACSDAAYALAADRLAEAGRRLAPSRLAGGTRFGRAACGVSLLALGGVGAWAGARRLG